MPVITPLTVDHIRALARATVDPDPEARTAALAQLGDPTPAELAAAAGPMLADPDRNVRVAALRVLARTDGPDAVAGVLAGLDDPVKRVREVAAKSSAPFVGERAVVERLQLAAERQETGSAGPALQVLAGLYDTPYGVAALDPVADTPTWLHGLPGHRRYALAALYRSRHLTPEVRRLLEDTVRDGTKEEAVAATRRLCGFRVAHDAELDDATRRDADRAPGRVWYWVRVPDER